MQKFVIFSHACFNNISSLFSAGLNGIMQSLFIAVTDLPASAYQTTAA
jgi:hypothetical protein